MIKLYVMYGGDIICRDISILNSGMAVSGVIELANPVFLIQHPKGMLMWDSGLSDELLKVPEGVEAWIFHLKMKRTLLSQFQEIDIHPDQVDYFAFSHIHNDHTGNAHYFKRSTLIMQEKEWDVAFHPQKKPFNYNDYKDLADSKVLKLNGDHDLFGDGTVQFVSTPGHTPGHQSLLINLEETGPVIISGDISYYEENHLKKGIPTFNSSREESLSSLEKIERIIEHTGAQLWIQHDKDRFSRLNKSPLFYQ